MEGRRAINASGQATGVRRAAAGRDVERRGWCGCARSLTQVKGRGYGLSERSNKRSHETVTEIFKGRRRPLMISYRWPHLHSQEWCLSGSLGGGVVTWHDNNVAGFILSLKEGDIKRAV